MNENNKSLSVNAQYVKDFSFENPSAPGNFKKGSEAPKIDISINVSVNPIEENKIYEVTLSIDAEAKIDDSVLFHVDLLYGGVFSVENYNDDERNFMLAVQAPTLLFPFARKLVADATQSGGFQPLMIDPVDFAALYVRKLQEEAQKKQGS